MKKLFKTLAVLAATLALSFGAASCSSDSSDSNSIIPILPPNNAQNGTAANTTAATAQSADFAGKIFGQETVIHLKADKSYVTDWSGIPKYRGTYTLTGDFTNGTLKLHQTEKFSSSGDKWVAEVEDETITITNGTFKEMDSTFTKVSAETSTKTDSAKTDTAKTDAAKTDAEKTDTAKTDTAKTDTGKTDTEANGNGNGSDSSDTTATNGSATFAATIWGSKVSVTFTNGTYKQYKDDLIDGIGTYTMTGDFTNGTMRLVETEQRKNGEWQKLLKPEIINCTITNGELTNKYGVYKRVSSDSGNAGNSSNTENPSTGSGSTDTTNTNNVNSKYKIGDVLLNDGTVVSYTENMTFTDEQKNKAVCVLAYFNDKGEPVGLGLHNSAGGINKGSYIWAKNGTTGYRTKFTDIICTSSKKGFGVADTATFTGDKDGSDNWAYICSVDSEGTANAAENYPAFDYVNKYAETFGLTGTSYGTGWYMPSIAELNYIYRNKTTVNSVLQALGGTRIAGDYWSSSQSSDKSKSAWDLGFSDGYLYYDEKSDNDPRVCCVRAFSN